MAPLLTSPAAANISNGYDTHSNVFNPVPQTPQGGIWTWNSKVGDLSNFASYDWIASNTLSLNIEQTVNDIVCQYPYTYSMNSQVDNIKSLAPVPIPVKPNPTSDYLQFNNATYPDFTQYTNGASFTAPNNGGTYTVNVPSTCTLPALTDPWHLIGTNAILVTQSGSQYSPLCVYQYQETPEYWTSGGSQSTTGYVPANTLTFNGFQFMPWFTYNYSMPIQFGGVYGSGTAYLNGSYYIYSPHNIQSPGNYLDPLLIGGGNLSNSTAGIFLNDNGTFSKLASSLFFGTANTIIQGQDVNNGLDLQQSSFIATPNVISYLSNDGYICSVQITPTWASPGAAGAGSSASGYGEATIFNAMLAADSANNNLFVIGNATASAPGSFCSNNPGYSGHYALYQLTPVPNGYYNSSYYTPQDAMSAAEGSSSPTAMQNAAKAYWYNLTAIQSSTVYLTRVTDLSDAIQNYQKNNDIGVTPYAEPLALATDANGDAFVMMQTAPADPYGGFYVAFIPNGGTPVVNSICTSSESGNGCMGGFGSAFSSETAPLPSGSQTRSCTVTNPKTGATEQGQGVPAYMAVSPDGRYLYAADACQGRIFIFSVQTTSNSISFSYDGAIGLAYNNFTSEYDLNVNAYLAGGGPFDSNTLKTLYAGQPPISDTNSSHVPIGLADSGGILYLLDEWLPPANIVNGCTDYCTNAVLMLRAFTYNGTEIPIHPTTYQDMYLPNGESLSAGFNPNLRNPPYGWPLAATFLTGAVSPNNEITYCAYGCDYGPSNTLLQNAYNGSPPIGPLLSNPTVAPFGQYNALFPASPSLPAKPVSFTSDFNNTLYLYLTPIPQADPYYTELIAAHFNPYNYTREAANPVSSYTCYIGIPPPATNVESPTPTPTPCNIDNSIALSYQYDPSTGGFLFTSPPLAPFIGMPSAFNHAETIGSPDLYQGYPLSLAGFGGGGGVGGSGSTTTTTISSSCSNSQYQLGTGNAPCANQIIVSNQIYYGTFPPIGPLQALTPTTLQTYITGSILVPYSYSYLYTQSLIPTTIQSTTDNANCINTPYTFANPSSSGSGTVDSLSSVATANSALSEILQSGVVLGQFLTRNYYEANLSDAGLILPPQVYINIFADRIFGEIYINQSVTPTGIISKGAGPIGQSATLYTAAGGTLTIAYSPTIYGLADQITFTSSAQEPTSIIVCEPVIGQSEVSSSSCEGGKGKVVASAPPGGGFSNADSITLTICSSSTPCLPVGSYQVIGCTPQPNGCADLPLTIGSAGTQYELVINASHSYNYNQVNYLQKTSSGTYPGFAAEASTQQEPATLNAQCPFCFAPGYYYNPGNLYPGNNILYYNSSKFQNLAKLFSQFKLQTYVYNLGLDLRYYKPVLGYNRINYTYVDEFNNTINMPLDADIANITVLPLNTTVTLNATNANQTMIHVQGRAGYYPSIFSTQLSPLPVNSPIYVYYDTDINFYTSNSELNPLASGNSNPTYISGQNQYYDYALNCSFGTGQGCALANPVFSSNPPIGQGVLGSQQANIITYSTQYGFKNTTLHAWQCSWEPNSLLLTANTWECNIYGKYNLPSNGVSPQGNREYCVPDYANGTGVLTSQLGLANIVTTNGAGYFSTNIIACGTGTAKVEAAYYGNPPPEPRVFIQPPLQQPYNTPSTLLVPSIEFNYSQSPNATYQSFPIGSYILSFGNTGVAASLAIAAGIAVYAFIYIGRRKKR